eukprot:46397-Chlamydomonas_euryale.AAC.1
MWVGERERERSITRFGHRGFAGREGASTWGANGCLVGLVRRCEMEETGPGVGDQPQERGNVCVNE